jgi:TolB-like protein/DNA-binding winged helix-turn-helix (wHTH) protein/uncharacterized membrane protein
MEPSYIFRFGPFVLDTSARELSRDGLRIKLRGQPYLILEILLTRAGEVMKRDELRQKIWPRDTFVDFEHGLNNSIKKLRHTLCDSARDPRYIETIPRLGYRLIVPVERLDKHASPECAIELATAPPVCTNTSRTAIQSLRAGPPLIRLIAGLLAVILATPLVLLRLPTLYRTASARTVPSARGFRSIAVLPLENLSNDPAQEYFADGMTEELIVALAQLGRLRVISRSSVMPYKGRNETVQQIGQELGVEALVEGTVERVGDQVRIRIELIDAAHDRHLWARSYDHQLKDILLLQSTAARDIATEIQGEVTGPNSGQSATSGMTVQPGAYEAYLEGLYFWNKRTTQGLRRAIECFQEATAKDPKYAPAFAGLADAYAMASSYDLAAQHELMPKARDAALRALEINQNLAEAHASLAVIAQNYDWDWHAAESEFIKAISANPNYATAHHWYAEDLALRGRFKDAFAEMDRARQLDPLSLIISADTGAVLYFSRQHDAAIKQLRTVLDMEPDFPRAHILVGAYIAVGRYADALADIDSWLRIEDSPLARAMQVYVLARSGHQDRAREVLQTLRITSHECRIDPITLVLAYTGLNDRDDAFLWLQKAYSEHSPGLTALKVDPLYDPLRSDSRFNALLLRLGLAE